MKLEINISKRFAQIIIGSLILILGGIFVYSFNSGGPPSFIGHSAEELDLSGGVNGDAVFNGRICLGGVCVSSWSNLDSIVCGGGGGGGTPCTPDSCLSLECGYHSNGCGGLNDCGGCPNGYACTGPGGTCESLGNCNTGMDCAPGYQCVNGNCESSPCNTGRDCPSGYQCVNGNCESSPCNTNRDCAPGSQCVSGYCA